MERRAILSLLALGLGAMLLGLGAVLLFARRLTGAIGALAANAEALGRGEAVTFAPTPLLEANRVADAMAARSARLRRVQRIGRVGGFEIDLKAGQSRRSAEYLTLQGLPPDTLSWSHEDWVKRLHPEDRERAERRFLEATSDASGETQYAQEYRIVTPTGEVRWISARAEVERDPETGRALWMMGAHVDVTELKRAEAARAEAEERLRLATEAAEVGFWDVDPRRGTMVWPPRVKAMFGLPPDAPADMGTFEAGLHPDDRPKVMAAFAAACDPARRALYDVEYRTVGPSDGAVRWVAAKGRALFDPSGECLRVVGTAIEVTDRKEAEARLRRVMDGLFTFVGLLTPDGVMVESNAAPMRACGEDSSLIGRPFWEGRGWSHNPAVAARIRAACALAAMGRTDRFDVPIRFADGSLVTLDFQIAPLHDESGRITHLVPSGVPVEERVQAERRLRELNNNLEALVEARTRELRAAEARLAHAQRMEALGQLAGGIAHDFNNVLQAVQGGAGLIGRRPDDADAVRRLSRMIAEAAERGSAVTRRLLSFSRRGDLRAEAVEPAPLLLGLREVLSHTLGAGIEVRVAAEPGLEPMLADKGQLETVLVNLATNGRDAMGDQGALTLSAAREEVRDASHPAGLPPGAYVRLTVSDTGPGMSEEVLARATEPFFTTKGTGQGTGLGLAMAKGFAEQSGGALRIESVAGRGCAVSLWLPVAASRGADEVEPGQVSHRGRRPRVLLAEDEALVREITAEALEAAGLVVLSAPGPLEALAMLDAGERVDLLVSDLSMPGMDGVALIRAAQERRPRLPAILLTGFATKAAELAVGGAVSGAFSLLRKPLDPQALAERIAVMLDRTEARAAPTPPGSSGPRA